LSSDFSLLDVNSGTASVFLIERKRITTGIGFPLGIITYIKNKNVFCQKNDE
jgi:hypothetical protein